MTMYLPGALRDVAAITRWYRATCPQEEKRFLACLRCAIEGTSCQRPDFACGTTYSEPSAPYSVVFITRGAEVRIVAVIHRGLPPG